VISLVLDDSLQYKYANGHICFLNILTGTTLGTYGGIFLPPDNHITN
jgi:hypothetical protein